MGGHPAALAVPRLFSGHYGSRAKPRLFHLPAGFKVTAEPHRGSDAGPRDGQPLSGLNAVPLPEQGRGTPCPGLGLGFSIAPACLFLSFHPVAKEGRGRSQGWFALEIPMSAAGYLRGSAASPGVAADYRASAPLRRPGGRG